MERKTSPLRGSVLLLLTAAIWGVAFVAQSVGMDYMGPFTFNGLRYFLGAGVLVPALVIRRHLSAFAARRGTGSPAVSFPKNRYTAKLHRAFAEDYFEKNVEIARQVQENQIRHMN